MYSVWERVKNSLSCTLYTYSLKYIILFQTRPYSQIPAQMCPALFLMNHLTVFRRVDCVENRWTDIYHIVKIFLTFRKALNLALRGLQLPDPPCLKWIRVDLGLDGLGLGKGGLVEEVTFVSGRYGLKFEHVWFQIKQTWNRHHSMVVESTYVTDGKLSSSSNQHSPKSIISVTLLRLRRHIFSQSLH